MLWTFEEREKAIHFIEVLSGTRIHTAFLLIGRLRYDISIRWINSFIFWLIYFNKKLKEIYNILSINRLWKSRLYEIGIIEKNFILFFGLSGLLSRSCNIKIDGRFSGYEYYINLNYFIFIAYNGDCFDRYILRFNEMIESCRIIYAIFYIIIKLNNNFIKSSFLLTNRIFIMELLIIEFLIQLPFILSLINELTLSIESSKGIYTIFIYSFPIISLNIILNDYLIINQLNKFCKYINIGDIIAVLGSIDFVLGSVDLFINV